MSTAIASVRSTITELSLKLYARLLGLRDESGQTVAEYALVLLVAATIAGALLLWAKQSGKLDAFFDAVFQKLLDSVNSEPAT